jgi:hypothetical protein
VRQQHLAEIKLDWASMADPAIVVPQARAWECQAPTEQDAGGWVVVAAVSIMENHNCGYLTQYPQQQLAGGSFYAFQLPASIPAAGSPGGPPPASQRKMMWGAPFDLRTWIVNAERHPERLPAEMQALMKGFQQQRERREPAPTPASRTAPPPRQTPPGPR